jgi:preprotein translocase SecE subunit
MLRFFRDVIDEVRKFNFPSKKETYITTITIFVTVILASLLISLADFVVSKIIAIIFGL